MGLGDGNYISRSDATMEFKGVHVFSELSNSKINKQKQTNKKANNPNKCKLTCIHL